ncbi:MAG: hypothetical protein AAFZ15_06950 [Bacteroidota bacterium]
MEQIIDEVAAKWLDIEGVESVGQSKNKEGEDCILVLISVPATALKERIPATYKGIPVELSGTDSIITH